MSLDHRPDNNQLGLLSLICTTNPSKIGQDSFAQWSGTTDGLRKERKTKIWGEKFSLFNITSKCTYTLQWNPIHLIESDFGSSLGTAYSNSYEVEVVSTGHGGREDILGSKNRWKKNFLLFNIG